MEPSSAVVYLRSYVEYEFFRSMWHVYQPPRAPRQGDSHGYSYYTDKRFRVALRQPESGPQALTESSQYPRPLLRRRADRVTPNRLLEGSEE